MVFHLIYKSFNYKNFFGKFPNHFLEKQNNSHLLPLWWQNWKKWSVQAKALKVSHRDWYKVSTLKYKYMYWSIFYSYKNKKCFIKSPKTLILSFVEIDCRQLPLPESLGWACDCKLMEIFTGGLLNDTLVNSPPRALAVRLSLPLFIAVVLLMEVWGCWQKLLVKLQCVDCCWHWRQWQF